MQFHFVKQEVKEGEHPPDSFLKEIIAWAKPAPDELFLPNKNRDFYTALYPHLGPWKGEVGSPEYILNRKAAMLEGLRCLGDFESGWRWGMGVDTTNERSKRDPWAQETGLFQVSGDSMRLDKTGGLRRFLIEELGDDFTIWDFIEAMKKNKPLCIGYAVRLLRVSTAWDGPINRGEVQAVVKRNAMQEFEQLLQEV